MSLDPTTNALPSNYREPYPGSQYGVLKVKYVPAPETFLRRRRVPRVRAFCIRCKDARYVTLKELARGICPGCANGKNLS
jgi:hypothetical protein